MEPLIFSLINKPANALLLPLYIVLIFGAMGHIEGLARLVEIMKGNQRLRWENLLPLVELGLLIGALGWWAGYCHFILMHTILGVVIAFTTLVVHHSDYVWSEGK